MTMTKSELLSDLESKARALGVTVREAGSDGFDGETEAILLKWPLGQRKAAYKMSCRLDEQSCTARFRDAVTETSWGLPPPSLSVETTTVKGWERSGAHEERGLGGQGGKVDFGQVREALKAAVGAAGWRFELEGGRPPETAGVGPGAPGRPALTRGTKTMFCPNCGKSLPPQSQFCPSCGHVVEGVATTAEAPAAASSAASTPAAAPAAPAAKPRRRMKTWQKIVAGIVVFIVGVIALAMFATGGLVKPVERHFAALHAGDVVGAYSELAVVTRQQTSLDAFKAMLAENPGLTHVTKESFSSRQTGDGQGELKGTLEVDGGGKLPIEIRLVKENGQWKILAYHVRALPSTD